MPLPHYLQAADDQGILWPDIAMVALTVLSVSAGVIALVIAHKARGLANDANDRSRTANSLSENANRLGAESNNIASA